MITITFETRSEKAVAFAKKLMESKKIIQKEMREECKTNPEIKKIIQELKNSKL